MLVNLEVLKMFMMAQVLKCGFSAAAVCSSTRIEFNVAVPWNRSMSSREFHLSYCPYRCLDGRLATVNGLPGFCPLFSCYQCSCKRPECEIYDICCPDISETRFELSRRLPTVIEVIDAKEIFWVNNPKKDASSVGGNAANSYVAEPPTARNASVRTPALGCKRQNATRTFLYIRSCTGGEHEVSDEVIGQCELNILDSDVTADNYVYVEDVATGAVYRNKFCAMCNGALDPRPVELTMHCSDYMAVYTIADPDAMLRAARKSDCCSVTRGFPTRVKTFTCDTNLFSNSLVNSCRKTSSNSEQDSDVIKACNELSSNYYRAFSIPRMNYYKNIFCAMCHENATVCFNDSSTCSRGMFAPQSPPFSVLINFGRKSKQTPPEIPLFDKLNCSASEWSSPDGRCLPLNCSPGKLLNNTCVTALTYVRGLQYTLRMWLIANNVTNDNNSANITDLNNEISSSIFNKIMNLTNLLGTVLTLRSLSVWTSNQLSADHSPVQLVMFWLEMTIIANSSLSRDHFEAIVVDSLITSDLKINTGQEHLAHFTPVSFYTSFFGEDHCAKISNSGIFIECFQSTFSPGNKKPYPCDYKRNGNVNISRSLLCSYITFYSTDYSITVNITTIPPSLNVTIDLNVTKVEFWVGADLNMMELSSDGALHVCHELLNRKLREVEEDREKRSALGEDESAIGFSQYVLTLACLGISQLCLLITVYTFLRFEVLRNTAGKFNLFLSLSLLLAQVFLLAGSHRFGPEMLCLAVGMMTHFFWLWMFTWTFLCSYRMAKIFTSPKSGAGASRREQSAEFARTAGASLLFPAAVVVITVVTSYATSGYSGYGRVSCYLDSELTIKIALIAPVAVITSCNIISFLATVFHIERVRRLQTFDNFKKEDRSSIFIYVKLSSLTGAFWVVAIVAEVSDVEVLRYTSILLNGLQGVFVFLSFIWNQRVLNLYLTGRSKSDGGQSFSQIFSLHTSQSSMSN